MEMNDTRVWKMPLKSGRDDFKDHPGKTHSARQFCFEYGWVGIGWECDSLSDNLEDPMEYKQALQKDRKNDPAALSAHSALAYKMLTGDLIWCRAKGDMYWLGKVEGSWRYRNTGKFEEFDLYQIRKCQWQKVGPGDTVPGPVKNAYAGRGTAICQIQREREAAMHMSLAIWERLTGEASQNTPTGSAKFSLSIVGHDDLEDLVALYLQAELGWYIVPSTAKHSTPFTEFVLLNSEGKRAYVQVKSGETLLEPIVEIPTEIDKFFVFDLNHRSQPAADPKIERINVSELLNFALTHKSLLPSHLQELIFKA